jgi:hypothetical protein
MPSFVLFHLFLINQLRVITHPSPILSPQPLDNAGRMASRDIVRYEFLCIGTTINGGSAWLINRPKSSPYIKIYGR